MQAVQAQLQVNRERKCNTSSVLKWKVPTYIGPGTVPRAAKLRHTPYRHKRTLQSLLYIYGPFNIQQFEAKYTWREIRTLQQYGHQF